MHGLGIIHRDLKPENIILSKDMHTKITDFGTAKILSDREPENEISDQMKRQTRTTFCGTAEYVSPEVLKNEASTKGSDLWALGCIVYQFLTGQHPFKAESEYLIFKKILEKEYKFPSNFPEVARDFVDKLLRLKPDERLGAGPGGYAELKTHPFFNGINFDKLNEMTPPRIVPHHIETQERQTGTEDNARWSLFLLKNEKVVYHSTIVKRRKLTAKRRQLILTDRPRLLYVDPSSMVLKGIIPWTKDLKFQKKSEKDFVVVTPKRNYVLEDLGNNSDEWEKVINQALAKT
jgi:3-phosphoinositide dependent protein kinase-1